MKRELTNDIIMEWDVVNWSRALPFWQSKTKLSLPDTKCLELGSRNGGLSLWLSSICKQVTYSDIDKPTEECIALHNEYAAHNITYEIVDGTKPINLPKHNLVVTKSILGVTDKDVSSRIISNIYDHLPEGGEYWFVENLEGSLAHQFLRNKCTAWGHRWTYLKSSEIKKTFSQFRELEYKTFGFLGTFGRNNFQRNILGTIDKLFFDKLTPRDTHYIVVGIARK